MSSFLDNLNEKPIFSALFTMGALISIAILLVSIAQAGRTSFMQRADEVLAVSDSGANSAIASDSANKPRRNSSVTAESPEKSEDVSYYTEPLIVQKVSLLTPIYKCIGSTTKFTLNGIRIVSNENHKAGVYKWKTDILSGIDYSNREHWRGSIPAGESDYSIDYDSTTTETLYMRNFSHPHDEIKIRVRVVSPNEVSSEWFTIPASEDCSQL